MITKGARTQGLPFRVSKQKTEKLKRVPFTEKLFQENWLQKFIFDHPQILPIEDIESDFAPLIPLGREIPTGVGFIDNLFISSDGYLTIVETKLWRNPEAKREVIGQIIDYAKELATWNFNKLDFEVKKKNQKGILQLINEFELIEEQDKHRLIDIIEKNLRRGRFLLLIVGDGIKESVEEMIEHLSTNAQILFTFGLIELQIYKVTDDNEDLIIIPNLIVRTKEITRAVIKIENNTQNIVTVETDFNERKQSKYSRNTITESDFFEQLSNNTDKQIANYAKQILNDAIKNGYYIDWKTSSFVVKLADPNGSGKMITLFFITRKGECGIGWSGNQLASLGIDKNIAYSFAANTAKLFKNVKQHNKNLDTWDNFIKLDELMSVYNNFWFEIEKFKNEIVRNTI